MLCFADAMSPPQRAEQTQECQRNKANRLRGGGAGKDCFLGLFGCFICFEGCKDCCECAADIICAYLYHSYVLWTDAINRLPVRDVLLNTSHISHVEVHTGSYPLTNSACCALYHNYPRVLP